HPVVPPARRARLQRHGDALRREPLRARSSAADRRSLAHAAPALSRRAYVLYRRGLAQSLQRRCQEVLSINAVMQRAPTLSGHAVFFRSLGRWRRPEEQWSSAWGVGTVCLWFW